MAQDNAAMTPEQAVATMDSVRGYRQGLTHRAAAVVWMVWGLALAGLVLSGSAPNVDEASEAAGEGLQVAEGAFVALAAWGVLLAAGAATTNAVWRAHALERQEEHRSWVAYAASFGLVVLVIGVGIATLLVVAALGGGPDENTVVVIGPVLAAVGAALLGILQRRRVAPWPGLVAAALLVAFQFALPLLVPGGDLSLRVYVADRLAAIATLVAFVGVGLWFFRRG